MDLPNTLMLLSRDPELVAWRARGLAIRVTPGHVVERVFVARPYRWQPNFGDLIATDWQYGTVAQFQKFLAAATAEGEG